MLGERRVVTNPSCCVAMARLTSRPCQREPLRVRGSGPASVCAVTAFGAPVRPMNGVCGEGLDRKAGASRMDAEPAMIWRRVGAGFGKRIHDIAETSLYLTLPGKCGLPRKLAAIPPP